MSNQKYLYIINIILALFFTGYLLYIRFLVIRLPKNLLIIENGAFQIKIIILIFVGIAMSVYIIKKRLFDTGINNSLLSRISQKLTNILENSLQDLYILILQKIPNNYHLISEICNKFYKKFRYISEAFFIIIIYTIRLAILFLFLIDVFIYFKLDFMYKGLYLLGFPLLIQLFIHMLRDYASNLEEIKSALIIEDLGIDKMTQLPLTNYNLKEDYNHFDLEYHVEQYILCSKIDGYLKMYDKYQKLLSPYMTIIIYSAYLIGWSYVLYVNIYLTLIC